MNGELAGKLFRIGIVLLNELKSDNNDVTIEMLKNVISDTYTIEINGNSICQISDEEIEYIGKHEND